MRAPGVGSKGSVNALNTSGSLLMIAPSQILYGFGLRDIDQIRVCQSLLIIVLGLALMYEVAWRGRSTRQAASALVACYSMLFVYHGTYDTVLLALPLVYAATAASRSRGPVPHLACNIGDGHSRGDECLLVHPVRSLRQVLAIGTGRLADPGPGGAIPHICSYVSDGDVVVRGSPPGTRRDRG